MAVRVVVPPPSTTVAGMIWSARTTWEGASLVIEWRSQDNILGQTVVVPPPTFHPGAATTTGMIWVPTTTIKTTSEGTGGIQIEWRLENSRRAPFYFR